jgi:hypothetical protein
LTKFLSFAESAKAVAYYHAGIISNELQTRKLDQFAKLFSDASSAPC